MKIVMVTSEANPLCKSGGLADVTYSLSRELNKIGEEAIIVLPYYKIIKNNPKVKVKFLSSFNIAMSWRQQYCGIFQTKIDGIRYYLIDNEYYFNRDELYGHYDDAERFAFFSLAALEALKQLKVHPDIIHVHDWQASMIPCLIKERFREDPFFGNIKTVLTIHNPAFKGFMDKYYLNNFYGLNDYIYDKGNVRFEGMVSTLKAAIYYADVITTVSPTHREELLTYNTSQGLNYCLELRKDDFYGILNGIDVVEFDPSKDKRIAEVYNADGFAKAKIANKKQVLERFGLANRRGPVYGVVSRLTYQKGFDLIFDNVDYLVQNNGTLLVLGSGEKEIEQRLEKIRAKYPKNVGIYIGYNDEVAHQIYAGSDFFLMPSLFEPCGIGQMIAQRYGSLPIVRETGGLKDTIVPFDGKNAKKATGFSFVPFNGLALGQQLELTWQLYADREKMKKVIANAMKLDRSWTVSAEKYVEVYRKALTK